MSEKILKVREVLSIKNLVSENIFQTEKIVSKTDFQKWYYEFAVRENFQI